MFNPLEEIYFWTGIMRDHTEFMLTALSSREQQFIAAAQYFQMTFVSLRNKAKELMTSNDASQVQELINHTAAALLSFINLKRVMERQSLQCKIEIRLKPTSINHMINEAMEFYRTLQIIQSSIPVNPTAENIHLHKVWLPDAAGHAAAIAAGLDPVETMYIKEVEAFKGAFNNMFIKANELGLMLERTCLSDGALEHLNEQVEMKMKEFICFLEKMQMLRKECKVLGDFKPLAPNHMIREEMYYLYRVESTKYKGKMFSDNKAGKCSI